MRNEQAVFLTFEFNGEADKSGLLYGMMGRFQCPARENNATRISDESNACQNIEKVYVDEIQW